MDARAVTTDVLLGMVPIALLIGLWQAIDSFGYAPVTLLPPPGLVFMRLVQQLFTSGFQQEIGATLFRLFAGFSIAVILGVSIGLAAAAIVLLLGGPAAGADAPTAPPQPGPTVPRHRARASSDTAPPTPRRTRPGRSTAAPQETFPDRSLRRRLSRD